MSADPLILIGPLPIGTSANRSASVALSTTVDGDELGEWAKAPHWRRTVTT